ncbi:homoserine kinase [Anaerospora sp.]|uniref:homoserine kinase n=1 Tax=Anaerospora sp. TaxID=1960278 RepID=UPI00289B01D1|nr:homoserine kinase [Anaerospora sp.]
MSKVTVRVPGTTANCGPGFDAIGMSCTIYNTMELVLSAEGQTSIAIYGEGSSQIPNDDRNIALQAVKLVLDYHQILDTGIQIRLTNNIPLARGLGSSAAAIVAGLVAANAVTGNRLSKQTLLEMATTIEGHPDNVAPAIYGGICLSVMHAAGTKCLSFLPPDKLGLVVAVPEFTLSTKVSRQVLPKTVPLKDAVFNVSRAALLVGALAKGELSYLKYALEDKLHQPYREKLVPGMEAVFEAAAREGALGVTISGAGPSLIAYTTENHQEIGQAMVDAFEKHGTKAVYHVLEIDTIGAEIIEFIP